MGGLLSHRFNGVPLREVNGNAVDFRLLMPVERKPLFRAEILAPQAAALPLGPGAEPAREILRKWARLLESARAGELNESRSSSRTISPISSTESWATGGPPPPARGTPFRARRG